MMLLTKPKKKLRKWLSGYKMIELSSSTINKSCKIVRTYFPSTLVLTAFRDVTGDQDLTNFPNARKFEENILKTRKAGLKIPLKSVTEVKPVKTIEVFKPSSVNIEVSANGYLNISLKIHKSKKLLLDKILQETIFK